MLLVRQSIVARVNSILGTYCKGTVHKKGVNVLAGEGANVAKIRGFFLQNLPDFWTFLNTSLHLILTLGFLSKI